MKVLGKWKDEFRKVGTECSVRFKVRFQDGLAKVQDVVLKYVCCMRSSPFQNANTNPLRNNLTISI